MSSTERSGYGYGPFPHVNAQIHGPSRYISCGTRGGLHPESTRNSITLRLLDHAERHWPQLTRVQVTYRGAFGYVTGVLRDGERIPLCRLRYGGSAHSFGFTIYSTASDRYQDAVLRTGLPTGTPQEAPDTACTIHLTGPGHKPSP